MDDKFPGCLETGFWWLRLPKCKIKRTVQLVYSPFALKKNCFCHEQIIPQKDNKPFRPGTSNRKEVLAARHAKWNSAAKTGNVLDTFPLTGADFNSGLKGH
jgi:hypothetical protein